MFDDARQILDYLPINFGTQDEHDYVSFLWGGFEVNYASQKYQFAFLAYHLLFMSVVYSKIWQLKLFDKHFNKTFLLLKKADKTELEKASSLFTFSVINERTIFEYFKLISKHSNLNFAKLKQLVDYRNDCAHAKGLIRCKSEEDIEEKIREILDSIEKIQQVSKGVIMKCFTKFLLDNYDSSDWEIDDPKEQFDQFLIKENYLSKEDVNQCLNFDLSVLEEDPNIEKIEVLFNNFKQLFSDE